MVKTRENDGKFWKKFVFQKLQFYIVFDTTTSMKNLGTVLCHTEMWATFRH